MNDSATSSTRSGDSYVTKSSEENQQPAVDRPPVQFDMSALSDGPRWKVTLRRLDLPVQAARIALFVFVFWFWESERIFEGVKVLGIQIFPEVNQLFRGTPSEAWDFFKRLPGDPNFAEDLRVTVTEAVLGFLYGASSGFITGLVMGRFRRLGRIFNPLLIFTNAVPKIALAPILLLWYGIDMGSKIALATLIVFFIVQVPVQAAVGGVEPDLDMVSSSLGATELQKFRYVVIPSILGPLFGSLRLASIYSILSVVVGEFLVSRRGLGQRLLQATNSFNFGEAFALIILFAAMAMVFNAMIGLAERWFLRWQDSDARGRVAKL